MKREKNLFEKIASFENLLQAFYKARKGKRGNANVAWFEFNMEKELFRLEEELKSGTYAPGPYKTFHIYEPKKRMISAAPFRDRVVHHAICNVIEPIFEKSFIFDSYANRKGKGTHAAIRRCQDFSRKYPYVLKADIQKYFPSIDHQVLKSAIGRKIGCPSTLRLIERIIDHSNPQEPVSGFFPGDDLFTRLERRVGLPMGNLTSQFFANIYLDPLDHLVKEQLRVPGYIRYVDDFVLYSDSKKQLHQWKKQIDLFLAQHLRLRLHPDKCVVFPVKDGIPFLGQHVFPTHRLVRKENLLRFRRRLDRRVPLFYKGEISSEKMESQLNAWLGHIKQADTFRLQNAVFWEIKYVKGVDMAQTREGVWKVW
ncbi:MAG: RNA-dependent DNA polymerase [Saprospirales bacterium]|nr:RNA-dependent DNA polymerase [Saprospirales bacterium]